MSLTSPQDWAIPVARQPAKQFLRMVDVAFAAAVVGCSSVATQTVRPQFLPLHWDFVSPYQSHCAYSVSR